MSESKVLVLASVAMVVLSILTALVLIYAGAAPGVIVLVGTLVAFGTYVGTFVLSKPYVTKSSAPDTEELERV